MELELMELLQGFLSLFFCTIGIIIGVKMLLKYFQHKHKSFLFLGMAFIGMVFPWMTEVINLIMIFLYNTTLNEFIYILIVVPPFPVAILCWVIALTELMYNKKKQKLILISYIIPMIIFEIVLFILLFENPKSLITIRGPFYAEFVLFIDIAFIILLVIFSLVGFLFVRQSLQSESSEIKLKGRLIFFGIIFVIIGSFLESVIPLSPITVVITRVFLTISMVLLYSGFALPNWMKKLFLREG